METRDIKVKVQAYEKLNLITKVSQIENDLDYITQEELQRNNEELITTFYAAENVIDGGNAQF